MPSSQHRSGESHVIAQVRARGDQAPIVRVMDLESGVDTSQIAVRFGRVLIYLEDRAALDSLVEAMRSAVQLAPRAFPLPRPPRR